MEALPVHWSCQIRNSPLPSRGRRPAQRAPSRAPLVADQSLSQNSSQSESSCHHLHVDFRGNDFTLATHALQLSSANLRASEANPKISDDRRSSWNTSRSKQKQSACEILV